MKHAEPELTVRRARPEDRPALLDLVTLCLGASSAPRSAAFWRWKHEENPFGPSPILLAEVDGRIVGLRAFLRWSWRHGDVTVPAVRPVDTATHPDWRGRGVFSRLTRQLLEEVAEEGIALVFNTPNRASGAGYRKMSWEPVGRAPALVRPGTLSGGFRSMARARSRRPSAGGPTLSGFPPAVELLGASVLDEILEARNAERADPRYRTPIDRRYLAWRHGVVPGLDYRALWSDPPAAPAAVVFRSRTRRGLRELVVAEILTPAGGAGEREASRLLRRVARSSEVDHLVAVASSGTPERRALRGAGFFPLPLVGPRLVVRTLIPRDSLADPRRASSWRLSAGALEVF